MQTFALALLGSGGAGIVTVGQLLLTLAARRGLYGLMSKSYGPQIRGGEAAALLRFSDTPVRGAPDAFDMLLALDWNNAERFADEIPLTQDCVVVSDAAAGDPPAFAESARFSQLPMTTTVKEIEGGRPNMYALGWLARWLGSDLDAVDALLTEHFAAKGADAIAASIASAAAGFESADEGIPALSISAGNGKDRWLLSGNEATGFGALRGGVRFVAAYPITPASDLLEYLAPRLEAVGGQLLQAEDELASINAIIGASWGGVPSLTATSGPGLALMMEGMGLAVASETPLVVVNVQRGGPSTGIPTKSEQTDLNIALYGMHGDAPHLLLACSDIADATLTTQWAVHLAESLQTPALLLSDQFLAQTRAIIDRPASLDFITRRRTAEPKADEVYHRYAMTADGLSPMAIPGQPHGMYTADGLEHEVSGKPSSAASDHQQQLDKRQRKIRDFDYGDLAIRSEGEGRLAIVCWGSTYGACHEARLRLAEAGIDVRVLALRLLAPFPLKAVREALADVDKVLVLEQSHSAQFLHYLRSQLNGLEADHLACPGPLPVRASTIISRVTELGYGHV